MPLRRLSSLICLALCCVVSVHAHADDVDGRWTGEVELRGSYFLERSTRVEIPMVRGNVIAPSGLRVGADFLVDSITSASIGQGAQTDDLFNEKRWGVGLTVGDGYELADDASFEWSIFGRYSVENDYFATAGGVDVLLSVAQHCSLIRFTAAMISDRVEKTSDATFEDHLRGASWRLSYEQVLTPTLVVTGAWDVAYLDGFLANAYRTVPVPGEGRLDETHPRERFRHAPSLQLRWHVPESKTSFHVRLRGYTDTWDVHALTTELRIYQEIGEHVIARARLRYYDQTESYFFDNQFRVPATGEHLVTVDPKMEPFHSTDLGLKLEWRLPMLKAIGLQQAWFDLSFDYRWNTNRFGNAILAQAGMRVPF